MERERKADEKLRAFENARDHERNEMQRRAQMKAEEI